MTWLYLLLAGVAALGLLQTVRGQVRSRRYLDESPDENPLQLSHLSTKLQALARDTRALRLSLEGPLRDGKALEVEEEVDLSFAAVPPGEGAHSLRYRLAGAIVHCGQSLGAGHYYAVVRAEVEGAWYVLDDEKRRQRTTEEVLQLLRRGSEEDKTDRACA